MFWPFKRAQRPPEKWYAPRLRFVGEQDGPPESQLKANLSVMLTHRPSVQRAYLAQVVYNDPQVIDVVLAIRSASGPDEQLIEDLGKAFAHVFHRDVHLDILFLSPEQEAEASSVCRAFYKSG
jgi:hypothetical protein